MHLLSFETSTKIFSLAISKDEKVLRFRNLKTALVLEDAIIPAMDKLLDSAKVKFKDIDAFAIAKGPGSFTSLRVGLALIKAFAMSTGKPVIGIASPDIIAAGAPWKGHDETVVISDARRGKVFSTFYSPDKSSAQDKLIRKSDYLLTSVEEVLDKVHGKTLFVGDGLTLYQKDIKEAYQKYNKTHQSKCQCAFAKEEYWYPQAKVMTVLAYERFQKNEFDPAATLVPLYLYPQDCQVSPSSTGISKAEIAGVHGR